MCELVSGFAYARGAVAAEYVSPGLTTRQCLSVRQAPPLLETQPFDRNFSRTIHNRGKEWTMVEQGKNLGNGAMVEPDSEITLV